MLTSEYANEQNKKELDGDNTDSFPLIDVQDKNESNETEQAVMSCGKLSSLIP